MTPRFVSRAAGFTDDQGVLAVSAFLESINADDWQDLLTGAVCADARVSALLGVSPTDDVLDVLGSYVRDLPLDVRRFAGRPLARVIAAYVRDDKRLDRVLVLADQLGQAGNEPALQAIIEDRGRPETLRTRAAFLLASRGNALADTSYWLSLPLRNDQCLLGPAMLALSEQHPDEAVRLLRLASEATMSMIELVVRDAVNHLLRRPTGADDLMAITATLQPAALEFLAELGIAEDGRPASLVLSTSSVAALPPGAPSLVPSQAPTLRVTRHMLGLFEGQLRTWAESRRWSLTDIVVIADRVDPPGNALHDAVRSNIAAGVRYQFFIPPSRKKALYLRDFKTRALDVADRRAAQELVLLHRLNVQSWRNVPYLYYVFRTATGATTIVGLRGLTKYKGIADEYEALDLAHAQAVFKHVSSSLRATGMRGSAMRALGRSQGHAQRFDDADPVLRRVLAADIQTSANIAAQLSAR